MAQLLCFHYHEKGAKIPQWAVTGRSTDREAEHLLVWVSNRQESNWLAEKDTEKIEAVLDVLKVRLVTRLRDQW
jgi:hypothetical protein